MRKTEYVKTVKEVCEYCGAAKEKFFVHLETPTRDFYWCGLACFDSDTQGWAMNEKGSFIQCASDHQDKYAE